MSLLASPVHDGLEKRHAGTSKQARSRQPQYATRGFNSSSLEDALTTPWPHEGSVLHAGKVALSAPAKHHDTLLGPPYAPYEPDGISCPPRMSASAAATLEYIGKRRKLTRHGYLADGNDNPQQQAGTDRTCPRTAEHCFQASANASLARGCTHGQVRSPQPQDACNLTQLRHALHSCPGLTPSCG